MYQRFWCFVPNNLMVSLIVLLHSNIGFTHGQADLCDRQQDLIEQCGEFHDCVVNEQVSPHIGFCKAEFEDISFTLCDRSSEMVPCPTGEICKIGTIDPNIGVCSPLSHPHQTTMDTLINGESEGCQSQSMTQSSVSLFFGLCLIGIYLHKHRLSSHQPVDLFNSVT